MNGALREATLAELRRVLGDALKPGKVRVERGHEGAVFLRILSERFEEEGDPEAVVGEILAQHGLRMPERTIKTLRAPSELEEGEAQMLFGAGAHFRGTPNWADALLFEPEDVPHDDREFGTAKVIAFWGVKGGVGRTTALSHVAALLGRVKRVLALDLDLDSPGLVATLAREPNGERPRFEELVRLAGDMDVSSAELARRIGLALRVTKAVPQARVLGPARADAEFVKDLLGPLAPSAMYRGDRQSLRKLVRAAIRAADAEVVLIDARSGYCDESAMAVLDLADEVVMFVSPAPSTFGSLGPAIEALERNRQAFGRPQIVHVVAGMLPAGEDTRKRVAEQLQGALDDERRRVAQVLDTPTDALPPDIHVMPVFYTGRVVENEAQILEDTVGIYREMAERMTAEDANDPFLAYLIAQPNAASIPSEFTHWTEANDIYKIDQYDPTGSSLLRETAPDTLCVILLMGSSPTFREIAASRGVTSVESYKALPYERRILLDYVVLSPRMDRDDDRIPTVQWLREHLRDGNDRLLPSRVASLMKYAFEIRVREGATSLPLLQAKHLRAALAQTAQESLRRVLSQVDEVEKRAVFALTGLEADLPRPQLAGQLTKTTGDPQAFDRLQQLGILRVTRRYDGTEMVRIVDLYALAPSLQIRRVGRR